MTFQGKLNIKNWRCVYITYNLKNHEYTQGKINEVYGISTNTNMYIFPTENDKFRILLINCCCEYVYLHL